ncbi:hypothetical protein CSC94_16385 [Zhengella mangrovi]|uniref:PAS fold-3 domain-containing protein n=1 Tax=Zhengella mangrovi TaxID=1982044 RepID=A0A2G1QL06_9HYPH|nr:hypothetical protein [Zhengella mangrovi]PHP65898.1 hypothetical protein CSC94_16385 [Zhengella mangrovi]
MAINNAAPRGDLMKIEISPQRVNEQSMHDVGLQGANLLDVLAQFEEFGIWRFDLGVGLAYFSRDACLLQGMRPKTGAMDLLRLASHYHPDDRPYFLECIEDAISRKSGFRYVLRTLVTEEGDQPRVVEVNGRYRLNDRNGSELYGTIRQVRTRVRSVDLNT